MTVNVSQRRILRMFGVSGDEVTQVVRRAVKDGCSGLRVYSRDGEFAISFQFEAESRIKATLQCDEWEDKLRAEFGDAVYGKDAITLPQATMQVMLENRKLAAAADERTGRLLAAAWEGLEHSEAVHDFGNQSYHDRVIAPQMHAPEAILKRYPDDPLQETAGRADTTRRISSADYAVAYTPAKGENNAFVLISAAKACWACPVPNNASDRLLTNYLMDMLRRMAGSLKLLPGTIMLKPGKPAPKLGEPELDMTIKPTAKPENATDVVLPVDTQQFERRQPRPEERQEVLEDSRIDEIAANIRAAVDAANRENDESRQVRMDSLHRGAEHIYATDEEEEYEDEEETPVAAEVRRHEEREQRGRLTTRIMLCVLLVLLIAAGVFAFRWLRANGNRAPAYRGYGTGSFDTAAQTYLAKAQEADDTVVGYLAFPGRSGALIYSTSTTMEQSSGAMLAADDSVKTNTTFGQYLAPGRKNSNTLVYCGTELEDLSQMSGIDAMEQNAGFTLYRGTDICRYKVVGVYYWDSTEESENYFDLLGYQNLTNYKRYLDFVLGMKVRSLYDIPVSILDDDSFMSLLTTGEDGSNLVITGRMVRENEDSSLVPSAISRNEGALLTAAMYEGSGTTAPDLQSAYDRWMQWYQTSGKVQEEAAVEAAAEADSTSKVDEMESITQNLLASTDKLLAGLTDLRGSANESESDIDQGAEGEMPDQEVSIPTASTTTGTTATATSTAAQQQESTATATPKATTAPAAEATTSPTATPQATEASSAAGETITVTMNGSVQELDLVECLAMIAQNELGSNAPDEAYKAQMVAAHCWILSQGGAPSVAGVSPNSHVRELAQQVAHVLVTYNGQVCFTPYFASASTGTCSSEDVWGGYKAYLQAVDSPYDQSYASNWHTDGNSSGTARFSRQTLQDRIQEKLGIDLSGIDPSQWFTILKTNQYGWVGLGGVQIGQGDNSTTCSGRWFRETLTAGCSVDGRSLRSNCFTVSYDAGSDCFIFDVYGYGHGCGLSQSGAIGYASNGWSYQDILQHYFTGVSITTY